MKNLILTHKNFLIKAFILITLAVWLTAAAYCLIYKR
jgi:hypothetical protein